jgi:hypothetical protein
MLWLSARKKGARQRLGEKDPNGKIRRATEVVEIPKLGGRLTEGLKSPPFLFESTFIPEGSNLSHD